MSISKQKFAESSKQPAANHNDYAPSVSAIGAETEGKNGLPGKPKRKQIPYKHEISPKGVVAMENGMKGMKEIQDQARLLLQIRADAAKELAELRIELTSFSKLDSRVPVWENKILRAELRLAGIDTSAAVILDKALEVERELGQTLATRRMVPLNAPGKPSRGNPDGHDGDGGQQTRGGPSS